MTPHRPIAHAEILDILEKVLGAAPQDLTLLKGQKRNPSFSCSIDGAKRLIRFRPRPANFFRDVYAWRNFKSPTLPVAEVFFVGEFDAEVRFCVSEFLPGTSLAQLDQQHILTYRDPLLAMARELHERVAPTGAAGPWDQRGQGVSPSWRQYLQSLADKSLWAQRPDEGDEGKIFDQLMALHRSLIDACPNLHCLLHGDFGLNNVLVLDSRITGLLDWQHSIYGDFLYDLARLDFWQPGLEALRDIEQRYPAQAWPLEQVKERVRCYQSRLAALALRNATLQDRSARKKVILQRIEGLL